MGYGAQASAYRKGGSSCPEKQDMAPHSMTVKKTSAAHATKKGRFGIETNFALRSTSFAAFESETSGKATTEEPLQMLMSQMTSR